MAKFQNQKSENFKNSFDNYELLKDSKKMVKFQNPEISKGNFRIQKFQAKKSENFKLEQSIPVVHHNV